jgi:geranylgeranyl pyrophosphate synthase
MMVWEALLKAKLPPARLFEVQHVLSSAFRRVLEGQAIELNWYREKKFDISEELYLRMVEGKTGALISASCEAGALMAGANEEQLGALRDFGMAVGIAFQVQDDVLNLVGSEAKYGKEIGGDMSEGKRSLITIHSLANASPKDKKRLAEILSSRTKDPAQVREAIDICKRTDSVNYAAQKAKSMVEKAKARLMVLPNNAASRRLLQLADFFIYREV